MQEPLPSFTNHEGGGAWTVLKRTVLCTLRSSPSGNPRLWEQECRMIMITNPTKVVSPGAHCLANKVGHIAVSSGRKVAITPGIA